MAANVVVLTNAFVSINSVDLSAQADSITLGYETGTENVKSMGDLTDLNVATIKKWNLEVNFNQSYQAGEVDATLFDLVGGAAVPIEIRADAGAVSATNPKYTATGIVTSYPPLSGTHGTVLKTPVTVMSGGATPDLVRGTS